MLSLYMVVLAFIFSPINFASTASTQHCQGDLQYDLRTHSCKDLRCPADSFGTYPKCACTKNHYVYNVYFNLCAIYCPANSTGSPPNCKCNDNRFDYVGDKNICEARKCPHEDSNGVYPNCSCTRGNFGYSVTLNTCFQVCPENSIGHWPSKCTCNHENATYIEGCNKCEMCTSNSVGLYPHCTCSEDGYVFSAFANKCFLPAGVSLEAAESTANEVNPECPMNTFGTFPRCSCGNNGTYDYISQLCHTCDASETYSLHLHQCVQCSGTDVFHPNYGMCVPAEIQCPLGSVGLHPYCTCDNGKYNSVLRTCEQCTNGYYQKSTRQCLYCPMRATGIYPNCECDDKSETYDTYKNDCGRLCSSGGDCERAFYYDEIESICKSVVGKECPNGSISTGNDCLCVNPQEEFNFADWICDESYEQLTIEEGAKPFENLSPLDIIVLKTMVG